ncbi:MAG: biotin--[acetyl-CoA-carboxylase] ligase [Oscillospiraceae bacterium]|nr:biotin--[acetyl-CoA-carboxylase] ligase [Oscillospiraceae bacterium]
MSTKKREDDILSVSGMLPFLSDKKTAGKINIHISLESTNKTAKELAASGAKPGTVVIADCQSAGKGRYGRSFFSPPNRGIYMSFIVRPRALSPTLVTLYAAVSVCRAIEEAAKKEPRIKWVNDIFLDGKKICGILTEAAADFQSGGIKRAVVGIGVNVTADESDFPEELKNIAGAVFQGEEPAVTRNRLAAGIINHMADFENIDEKETLGEYKKRLFMLGKRVWVSNSNETYEALAVDIDETGRLIVKKDDGRILPLSSGEVTVKI